MIWGIPLGNLHDCSLLGHPPLLWGQSQGRLLLPIESRVAGLLAPIFGQGWCENLGKQSQTSAMHSMIYIEISGWSDKTYGIIYYWLIDLISSESYFEIGIPSGKLT